MISDADLLNWTKAEEADTDLLRSLERAAVARVEQRTGYYWGVEAEIVETRFWRGGPIELQVEPSDGTVAVEYWDGSAWAAADASTFYLSGRFLRAAATPAPVWPATTTDLRLTYTGGYTEDASDPDVWDAPEEVKDLVRLIVGLRYLYREGTDASGRPIDYDAIIDAAARDMRRVSV